MLFWSLNPHLYSLLSHPFPSSSPFTLCLPPRLPSQPLTFSFPPPPLPPLLSPPLLHLFLSLLLFLLSPLSFLTLNPLPFPYLNPVSSSCSSSLRIRFVFSQFSFTFPSIPSFFFFLPYFTFLPSFYSFINSYFLIPVIILALITVSLYFKLHTTSYFWLTFSFLFASTSIYSIFVFYLILSDFQSTY